MRRFYILEPSKVGSQHITLIEGYLHALRSSEAISTTFELMLVASKNTFNSLPKSITEGLRYQRIPVMNPEKKRQILKTVLEFLVTLRSIARLRDGDVLLVTCLLPTTLWLLELASRLVNRSGIHVVLHGEIEALFAKSPQSFWRVGYWAARWLRSRKSDSRIALVVLDDFIREKLLHTYPTKFPPHKVYVVHHPILPQYFEGSHNDRPATVCFIGYRTGAKGYDEFLDLARVIPAAKFLAIGGGKVEDVRSGRIVPISGNPAYLREISKCSAAVFPYSAGYTACLSAAALDAISTGVRIFALDRPFFRSLASCFGDELVTIVPTVRELRRALSEAGPSCDQQVKENRLERLSSSRYGVAAVRRSLEHLALGRVA